MHLLAKARSDPRAFLLDDRPSAYFRANHAFTAIAIPSGGQHEITPAYVSEHFTPALDLALVGVVGLVGGAGCLWFGAGKKSPVLPPGSQPASP